MSFGPVDDLKSAFPGFRIYQLPRDHGPIVAPCILIGIPPRIVVTRDYEGRFVTYPFNITLLFKDGWRDPTVVPPGAILQYNMETLTADGKMRDLSGNGHHGTVTGTTDVAGKVGRGRSWSADPGVDEGFLVTETTAFDGLTGLTVLAWVKPSDPGSVLDGYLIAKRLISVGPTEAYGFYCNIRNHADGRPIFQIGNSAGVTQTFFPPGGTNLIASDDVWTLVAFRYGNGKIGAVFQYPDGQQVVEEDSTSITSLASITKDLTIGYIAGPPTGDIFRGIMDEVLIYDRALSATEIADYFAARVRVKEELSQYYVQRLVDVLEAWNPEFSYLDLNPVLAYDMETLIGTKMKDLSGNGNHGAISGSIDALGKFGRAREFDGIDDFIQAPHSASIGITGTGFTVAAWAYLTVDNVGSSRTWIRKNGNFLIEPGGLGTNRFTGFIWVSGGTQQVTDIAAIPLNQWHHFALRYDGQNLSLWRDGTKTVSVAETRAMVDGGNPLDLGKFSTETYFGRTDEVLVFNRALSDGEITALASLSAPRVTLTEKTVRRREGRLVRIAQNYLYGCGAEMEVAIRDKDPVDEEKV